MSIDAEYQGVPQHVLDMSDLLRNLEQLDFHSTFTTTLRHHALGIFKFTPIPIVSRAACFVWLKQSS